MWRTVARNDWRVRGDKLYFTIMQELSTVNENDFNVLVGFTNLFCVEETQSCESLGSPCSSG